MEDLKAAEGGRVIDPQLEQFMRNPIVGIFMIEASIASEIVRSIPLDDRNRDYVRIPDKSNIDSDANRIAVPAKSNSDLLV